MRTIEQKAKAKDLRRELFIALLDEVDLCLFCRKVSPVIHDEALCATYEMYRQQMRWCF